METDWAALGPLAAAGDHESTVAAGCTSTHGRASTAEMSLFGHGGAHRVAGEASGAHLLAVNDGVGGSHGARDGTAVVQHLEQLTEIAEHAAKTHQACVS